MKVVLMKDMPNVGKKDQIVEVSSGYARNFLIPKGFAAEATGSVLNEVKNREAAKAHKAAVDLAEAKETASRLEGVVVTIKVKAGSADSGKLFGSVTAKDIGDALEKEHGITVDRRKIGLDEPIKKFGKYEIPVKLHPQVTGTVNVVVTGA
ncbi:MAG: 50S ribosomal protein L9 [Clostridia bacterium]|nr:50S ribosomal protein L9 [Clostridia bacterium]